MNAPTKLVTFTLSATDGMARRGRIDTPRGDIQTPAFMPVGTAGTVKAMYPEQVRETGADILLGNTYHLMLRPGAERVASQGGLHTFMDWQRPILTDSGGFQVMSLAQLRKLTENGVTFRSHIDGSSHELTPERSIEIQTLLDSDIIMQLDECLKLPAERKEMERAMELSLRWAARSKDAFNNQLNRALFGIVQGGDDPELRARSAQGLKSIGFDGYAVGGLAVGEPQDVMFKVIEEITPELPTDRPRYLMGVGKPDDILGAIGRGIDMFDCVHPTRAGRHGHVYTRFGVINLKNARHRDDHRPIDEASPNPNCRRWSRAYLHHLVKTEEILGAMILSQINLAYYQELVQGCRGAIEGGRFNDFAAETRAAWAAGDLPVI
ncbi:MAG: tRNA guanosine(34) transglycosylase Tgt [Alphaproteobacteria bacterium]|jgi:queuine tRNA-ribosyltransferase|uniref:tRNA guanosine(34) transglycosylase Tgt n=1 Tax=Devosia sp. XGJD_8 TaxID=3391187 RepID=UPI001D92D0A7|nr:tRNA guanosine(34) transglycosylase Tgt [Alphaproteobacteria bacterium]MBU1561413.1 tRNA guanosine(34) transglycosylase Tgt [Alphaproteobacteria bacterium]MBU2302533.1 tRNA guanosine(34) transglycosylase Tgt [Alphaproteobacteria bacterium]MBU2367521.1 tRNA guanosine(34) transglycosylase Tgt [Alphaproteobacteria bacterium]